MCTGPSTGPAPAISADSVRTPPGSSRLQTASGFWAPSIATLAADAPSGETSTGRSQAPEAAARRADWTTPMPATVQTATALPDGATAILGSAAGARVERRAGSDQRPPGAREAP